MSKLKYFIEKLRASFWFLPLLLILTAILLAIFSIAFDKQNSYTPEGIFQYLLSGSAGSARNILSTIAGAMIGVAGTVFSITLVALTLASSQFGSRLLRNFMYDRINQVVLGTYVSTFIYCLIVLNAVEGTDDFSFVPVLSVAISIITAIANIFLLVVFIHHVAISIQSDKVISDISDLIEKNIEGLFPKKLGQYISDKPDKNTDELYVENSVIKIIKAKKGGYIQSIDNDTLFELSQKYDLIIWVKNRPGDFIVTDMQLVEIFSNKNYDDSVKEQIETTFIIGKTRTTLQDAEFSIYQMVEIALRALSPGVNDPNTAISCIDNLSAAMCHFIKVGFPSKYRYDENETLRIIAHNISFEDAINSSFGRIRHYAANSPFVINKLLNGLLIINKFAIEHSHKDIIQKHSKMVLDLAKKSFEEDYDIAISQAIYDKFEFEE